MPTYTIENATCCCGGSLCLCDGCATGKPLRLRVVISGVVNDICEDCSTFNGTFILEQCDLDDPGCHWGVIVPDTGCYGVLQIKASYVSGTLTVWIFSGTLGDTDNCAIYSLCEIAWSGTMSDSCETWNDDIPFDLNCMGAVCDGTSSTCHVSVEEFCDPLCFCYGTMPVAYNVAIAGVANKTQSPPFECTDGVCTDYNGLTFEVPRNVNPELCQYTEGFEGAYCDFISFVIEEVSSELICAIGIGGIALDVTFSSGVITFPIDCTESIILYPTGGGIGTYCDWSAATVTLTPVY